MATISAGDLVNLRTKIGKATPYLSILQPVTLLAALVNNGSITRGARTIAYDGGTGSGFSTIEAGQLFEVDTATGTEIARVKSITGSQSSGTITLGENSILFADNQVIRIKHHYPIFPIPPTIRNGVFYKDYDTVYVSQNSQPNPVAIIGSHRAGWLSAGSAVFAFSAASYAIAQGASIASHAWSCVHNGGGTTGITISAPTSATTNITVTSADTYWVKYTVTDSNGKTQSTYRCIFAYDTSNLPYKDFTINGLNGDWQSGGWRYSLQATGDSTLADIPDRTLVVLWYDNFFNSTSGYVDLWGAASQNIIHCGYLRKDQDNDSFPTGVGNATFEVTTPDSVMDALSLLGSVSVEAVSSPTTWYQYASWLTVGRAIHHLLKWHSTVLETCDVYSLTANTLGVKVAEFSEQSLLQMINGLGFQRGIFAKLVSDRLGRLHFVVDSQMLNTSQRGALDTVFTLATSDISDVVDVVRDEEDVTAVTDLDGFSFDGTASLPFISIIPGYVETISINMPEFTGQGNNSIKAQVLDDQTDSNEKCGRVHAQQNRNPYELRFATPYNGLGAFDIVPDIGFYVWGIANDGLKRETDLNGIKLICRHVDVDIKTNGIAQTSVVFEPEAQGPDAIPGNYPTEYPAPVVRQPKTSNPYQYLFIGTTDSGVFRKAWGGTPEAVNTGLTGDDLKVRSLRINPVTKDVWIANKTGVAYSDDLGATWNEITKATLGTPVNDAGDSPAPATADLDQIDLCFEPGNFAQIYLLRVTTSPKRAWLYASSDYGATWSNTQIGI